MLRFVELPFINPQEAYKRLPLETFGAIVLHSGHDPLPDHSYPLARYCFFAAEPFAQIKFAVGDQFALLCCDGERKVHSHPFSAMRDFWKAMMEKLGKLPNLPTPLPCGLVGYLSYDLRVT
ncbi:MAG: aminodeoxychorismate synthase, component I, partial [Armatimonadota bacterium]|nr:aminodeoxychorismate synthase, component I [Armatimonadota bacterium]MDW8144220.1 aminodeoxychorismate synthase, component I [Armatimonadota bacterium]